MYVLFHINSELREQKWTYYLIAQFLSFLPNNVYVYGKIISFNFMNKHQLSNFLNYASKNGGLTSSNFLSKYKVSHFSNVYDVLFCFCTIKKWCKIVLNIFCYYELLINHIINMRIFEIFFLEILIGWREENFVYVQYQISYIILLIFKNYDYLCEYFFNSLDAFMLDFNFNLIKNRLWVSIVFE